MHKYVQMKTQGVAVEVLQLTSKFGTLLRIKSMEVYTEVFLPNITQNYMMLELLHLEGIQMLMQNFKMPW